MQYSWQCCSCVVVWFSLNISIGSLMKYCYLNSILCNAQKNHCITFEFPIFTTFLHMLYSRVLCGVWLWAKQNTSRKVRRIPFAIQIQKILPLAILFCISVAFGNVSLRYVYPSFNQMVSSTTPLITMLVEIALLGSRYNTWAHIAVWYVRVVTIDLITQEKHLQVPLGIYRQCGLIMLISDANSFGRIFALLPIRSELPHSGVDMHIYGGSIPCCEIGCAGLYSIFSHF